MHINRKLIVHIKGLCINYCILNNINVQFFGAENIFLKHISQIKNI